MKLYDEKAQCSGCSACCSICPVDAIAMKEDEEGFLFPDIDKEKCIECGMCRNVCPMKREADGNENPLSCYAVKAEEAILNISSSGGMFSLLADDVLGRDGYVCGAAMQDDYTGVRHIIISDRQGLSLLRKSKYVQSDLNNCFRQIRELLENDKEVLFVGCPCQVDGLKNYLRQDYDNLILVDLICHGVPSPKAWRYQLEELAAGKEVTDVCFRDKTIEEGSCVCV